MAQLVFTQQAGDKLVDKALAFVRAIGVVPGIMEAMSIYGYTQAENDHGWSLVLSASGYRVQIPGAAGGTEAAKAMVELDQADESILRRGEAVMRRFFPAQADFVFEGLSPGSGVQAVVSISTFLKRLDDLESSPAREATRTEDHAALAALAPRGITKAERDRLAGLVKLAQLVATSVTPVLPVDAEQRDKDLIALQAWHQDWAETARAVIKRREFLVRMGLSKRRTGKKGQEIEPTPPTLPAPQPIPAPPAITSPPGGANGSSVVVG